MEIKVGDFVRWTGEKCENECQVDGVNMITKKLPFTDGNPRRVLSVSKSDGKDYIRLRLEGIKNGVLIYPTSMLEVVPQEQELPQYGEKIIVWYNGIKEIRIFVGYIKGAARPIIVVNFFDEEKFRKGEEFGVVLRKHFKRITCEGKPVGVEV